MYLCKNVFIIAYKHNSSKKDPSSIQINYTVLVETVWPNEVGGELSIRLTWN